MEPFNLAHLECRSIDGSVPLSPIGGGVQMDGVKVYAIKDGLYLPQHQLLIVDGFVPLEAIVHNHLTWRKFDAVIVNPAECCRLAVDVCVLGNVASFVFYHWIEELLKVVVLEAAGFEGSYVISDTFPSFCFESLAMLEIANERVIRLTEPAIFDKVFFTTRMSMYECRKIPSVIRSLRDQLHYQSSGSGEGLDRIWAARGETALNSQRDLVNAEEVYGLLSEHGFRILDFGKLSFERQIQIDRSASVIAGPHGSAMIHCAFMHNNRTVIEAFSPNYIAPAVLQVCLVLGHGYHQIVHDNAFLPDAAVRLGRRVLVDLNHLELVLSKIPKH